jgi:hypothetical protein
VGSGKNELHGQLNVAAATRLVSIATVGGRTFLVSHRNCSLSIKKSGPAESSHMAVPSVGHAEFRRRRGADGGSP